MEPQADAGLDPSGGLRPGVGRPHRLRSHTAALARRAVPELLVAAALPAVCFIVGRDLWGLAGGIGAALVWGAAAQAWRMLRGHPCSAILVLGLVSLVVRSSLALSLHSARLYFIAPAVVTALTGAVYIGSGLCGTPLLGRVVGELVPATILDAQGPRWKGLLRMASVFYGTEQIVVSFLSVIMVLQMDPGTYAALHPMMSWAVLTIGAALAAPFLRGEWRRATAGAGTLDPGIEVASGAMLGM